MKCVNCGKETNNFLADKNRDKIIKIPLCKECEKKMNEFIEKAFSYGR